MPQPFINAVLTTSGAEMLTRAQAGEIEIEFTRIATGSGEYEQSEKNFEFLKDFSALREEKQSFAIGGKTIVGTNTVKLSTAITNNPQNGNPLDAGYRINEMGVFAKERDGDETTEILYSITVTAGEFGDFMPPYDGNYAATIIQDYFLTVDNSANVMVVQVDGTYALAEDLQGINERVTVLEGQSGQGGVMIGYYNPTDKLFYGDGAYTTLLDERSNTIYIDINTRSTYYLQRPGAYLTAPALAMADWMANPGEGGYIYNKPQMPQRNIIVTGAGTAGMTTNDAGEPIKANGTNYTDGTRFALQTVTISGKTETFVVNTGNNVGVKVSAMATIVVTTPGEKVLYVGKTTSTAGDGSQYFITSTLNCTEAGTYTLNAACAVGFPAGYVMFLGIAGSTGEQINDAILTIEEI